MKLFFAPTSPYARKIRVLINEKSIAGIEQVPVSPFDLPSDLLASNPLSKVPCLVLDDQTPLYDSPVILEYLDDLTSPFGRWLPASGPERWTTLRRCALADGLIDTCLMLALETLRRPENERSPHWIASWCSTLLRVVAHLETEIGDYNKKPDMSHITLACALGYLDLRAASHLSWRTGNPDLTAWYDEFALRPSMVATVPA